MRTVNRWLVVTAGGEVRVRTRRPRANELALSEFAVPLRLRIPDAWGAVLAATIEVTVPEPPAVTADGDDVTVVTP